MDALSKAVQSAKEEHSEIKGKVARGRHKWVRRSELERARALAEETSWRQERGRCGKRPPIARADGDNDGDGDGDDDGKSRGAKRKRRRRVGRAADSGAEDGSDHDDDDDDDNDARAMLQALGKGEVFRLLRRYGQPVTFFGETDFLRVKRLRRVQLQAGEHAKGQRNVDWVKEQNEMLLMEEQRIRERQDRLHVPPGEDAIDPAAPPTPAEAAADPSAASAAASGGGGGRSTSAPEDGDTSASALSGLATVPSSAAGPSGEHCLPTRPADMPERDYVRKVMRRLLREWEHSLDERPIAVKKTAQGRADYATWRQTKEYIRPLFKQLKQGTLNEDVQWKLHDIVVKMAEKDYVMANDMYLRLAIGNAPWPMGVTMVGIHERSSRQKISGAVAHILNDEKSRKYIQCVKRLISFCEKKYPASHGSSNNNDNNNNNNTPQTS